MELPVLKYTEQLGLQGERHIPDFVEEDRTTVGHFQFAFLLPIRSGECPAFMAEKFILEECLGQRHAIDDDERHGTTRTPLMNRACKEFFSSPTLAQQ